MTPDNFSELIIGKLGTQLNHNDTDSNLPDIKVKVTYTALLTESVRFHVLRINVSNHGKYPVFLEYPRIELRNGWHIPVFKDAFYGNTISEIGKLEPGDSFVIHSNPDNNSNSINELDYIVVKDKIGKEFKGSSEELNKAINSLNKSKLDKLKPS